MATVGFTCSPPCEHLNGWWTTVPRRAWIFFTARRRVFVCEDCLNILDADTLECV